MVRDWVKFRVRDWVHFRVRDWVEFRVRVQSESVIVLYFLIMLTLTLTCDAREAVHHAHLLKH